MPPQHLMRNTAAGGDGLHLPDDTPAMTAAIRWCLDQNLPVIRCSRFHLKVGKLNFWPDKGSISLDGNYRHPQKGLAAFQALILARRQALAREAEIVRTQPEPIDSPLWGDDLPWD